MTIRRTRHALSTKEATSVGNPPPNNDQSDGFPGAQADSRRTARASIRLSRKLLPAFASILVFLTLTSCNLLTPFVILGEQKKKVSPEFDKLAGSRVAVLIWTDPATLFDYPHARFELASYLGDKLDAEMRQRKLDIDLIDPRDVEDYIQKEIDAQINPQAVGRHFQADFVVYIEVLAFQIRDAAEPQFLRGRIETSVSVHDVLAGSDRSSRYELTAVKCEFPEGGPILLSATNSPLVREQLYHKFAELVARKFYEYTVQM